MISGLSQGKHIIWEILALNSSNPVSQGVTVQVINMTFSEEL